MVGIIGHCRFSWFGISDTGRAISDTDMAQTVLWHPERMAVRFHLFETIMLPSILAQTDTAFRLLLLVSEDMPEPYRARLDGLLADTPHVEVLSTAERDIGRALRPVMQASVEGNARAVHFRIDDDDALCSTYIERLRALVARSDFAPGTAISFPRGVVSFLHEARAKHAPYLKPYVAAGLAFVVGGDYLRNPFQVQHRQIGKRQPNYVDPTWLAYQVTLHAVNNTKGYDRITHDLSTMSSGVDRILRNNPDLAQGAIVDPGLDGQIDEAFGFVGASGLRGRLEETLNPKELARTFGFL